MAALEYAYAGIPPEWFGIDTHPGPRDRGLLRVVWRDALSWRSGLLGYVECQDVAAIAALLARLETLRQPAAIAPRPRKKEGQRAS